MDELLSLQEFINLLINDSKIKINIFYENKSNNSGLLAVNYGSSVHSSDICNCVKITQRGQNLCTFFKQFSKLRRDSSIRHSYYCGMCPFGITDIVVPVYIKNKLFCTVYVTNIINNIDETLNKMKKAAKYVNLDWNELRKLTEFSEITYDLSQYIQIAKAIRSYILLLYERTPVNNTVSDIVYSIQLYIREHYENELSVHELAKKFHSNQNHIGFLFKQKTGITIKDYLNEIRIHHAKNSLKYTENSVLQISLNVGYKNVTYFNRVFKKLTGLTPLEFRKNCRSNQALLLNRHD